MCIGKAIICENQFKQAQSKHTIRRPGGDMQGRGVSDLHLMYNRSIIEGGKPRTNMVLRTTSVAPYSSGVVQKCAAQAKRLLKKTRDENEGQYRQVTNHQGGGKDENTLQPKRRPRTYSHSMSSHCQWKKKSTV